MNTGHGHVTPRDDGAKARCGGPGICSVCQQELAHKNYEAVSSNPAREKLERLRDEFAIEMAGKLLMKLNFTGSFPDVNQSYRMLMEDAYAMADAALKARENK